MSVGWQTRDPLPAFAGSIGCLALSLSTTTKGKHLSLYTNDTRADT